MLLVVGAQAVDINVEDPHPEPPGSRGRSTELPIGR